MSVNTIREQGIFKKKPQQSNQIYGNILYLTEEKNLDKA